MKEKKILILGAGLSGLSIAYFLKKKGFNPHVFEKESVSGGMCRSIKNGDFTFDLSGHLLHFRNPQIKKLVKDLLANNLKKHTRQATVFSHDRFINFPFQTNFDKLPSKVSKECLSGLAQADKLQSKDDQTFLDWIYNRFGQGIAKHFMIPYNLKFWQEPLSSISSEWAHRFIVTPKSKSAKDLKKESLKNLGYNAEFWYPKKGGIEELIKALLAFNKNIFLNKEVVEIDLKKKTVRFKDGKNEKYDLLISTIPLPQMLKIIKDIPHQINKCLKDLKWVSIYNINFGIQGKQQEAQHWTYFPQKNISFFRVGFFHNFSKSLTPEGSSSLYVEVSYSKKYPINKEKVVSRVKRDLKKNGIISDLSKICCTNTNDLSYGYPIYDKKYRKSRNKVLEFLSDFNINSIGRYGSWRYMSMEDVMLESRKLAGEIKNAANK